MTIRKNTPRSQETSSNPLNPLSPKIYPALLPKEQIQKICRLFYSPISDTLLGTVSNPLRPHLLVSCLFRAIVGHPC